MRLDKQSTKGRKHGKNRKLIQVLNQIFSKVKINSFQVNILDRFTYKPSIQLYFVRPNHRTGLKNTADKGI